MGIDILCVGVIEFGLQFIYFGYQGVKVGVGVGYFGGDFFELCQFGFNVVDGFFDVFVNSFVFGEWGFLK